MKMQVMKLYYLNILVIPAEILESRYILKNLVNIMFYVYSKISYETLEGRGTFFKCKNIILPVKIIYLSLGALISM